MKKILTLILTFNTLIPAVINSFDFLNIGTGGVTTALGKTSCAMLNNIEGLYNNPATIASIQNNLIFSGSINPYMGMSLWNLAVFFKLSDKIKLAIGGNGLSYGDITGDIAFNGDPGRLLKTGDFLLNFNFSYALKIKKIDLYLGTILKYARESLDGINLSGLLFDFGSIISYNFSTSKVSLGVTYKNAGIDLSGLKQDISLPSKFIIGVGYNLTLYENFSFNWLLDYNMLINGSSGIKTGLELGFLKMLFIRTGYIFDNTVINNLTFGGGAKFNIMKKINIAMDYAFIPMSEIGNQQNIQISIFF